MTKMLIGGLGKLCLHFFLWKGVVTFQVHSGFPPGFLLCFLHVPWTYTSSAKNTQDLTIEKWPFPSSVYVEHRPVDDLAAVVNDDHTIDITWTTPSSPAPFSKYVLLVPSAGIETTVKGTSFTEKMPIGLHTIEVYPDSPHYLSPASTMVVVRGEGKMVVQFLKTISQSIDHNPISQHIVSHIGSRSRAPQIFKLPDSQVIARY